MARNLNIDEILFPVEEQRVCLYGQKHSIPGYKAIVGNFGEGFVNTFSLVSSNYKLVSNAEAIELGKEIHQKLFPGANASTFEVFNIIRPETRSFCQIDVIDKNYSINVWKNEVYIPFFRLHNSYNRSRSLKFEIGFCRKLCDNGVIFERDFISIKFAHTKQEIDLNILTTIDVSRLKKLESDFINRIKRATEIQIPKRYFAPLAAKVLNRNFNLDERIPEKREQIRLKLNQFISFIDLSSQKYVFDENMGETAYAFFNVITDYASNNNGLQAGTVNGLQTKCGMWVNELGQLITRPDFSWDKEVQDFQYVLSRGY